LSHETGSTGSPDKEEFSPTKRSSAAIGPDFGWSVVDHGLW